MAKLISVLTNIADNVMAVPVLGWPLKKLSDEYVDFVQPTDRDHHIDFDTPGTIPLRNGPDSMMWRVYANPGVMYIAGVSAVMMEMAEESTRTGVLDFSSIKQDPIGRLKRTGSAAVGLLYGTEESKQPIIKRLRHVHGGVNGTTPSGKPFRAMDPDLMRWTYVTFAWSSLKAYIRFLDPTLPVQLQDQFWEEVSRGTSDFGDFDIPMSAAAADEYINNPPFVLDNHEFLAELMMMFRKFPGFEFGAPAFGLMCDAAFDIMPDHMLDMMGQRRNPKAAARRRPLVTALLNGATVALRNGQAQRACRREGVSPSVLNHRPAAQRLEAMATAAE